MKKKKFYRPTYPIFFGLLQETNNLFLRPNRSYNTPVCTETKPEIINYVNLFYIFAIALRMHIPFFICVRPRCTVAHHQIYNCLFPQWYADMQHHARNLERIKSLRTPNENGCEKRKQVWLGKWERYISFLSLLSLSLSLLLSLLLSLVLRLGQFFSIDISSHMTIDYR